MKIVNCAKLKERKDLRKKFSEWRKEREREREDRKETKRNRQGCDSVFLACASFHWYVRKQLRPSSPGTSRTSTSRIK